MKELSTAARAHVASSRRVDDAGTVNETIAAVRRARGLEALQTIRRESQLNGAARMTAADIDALIARTRRSRPR